MYSDSERDEFPEDLASLSAVVARATGFPDFSAQGAIVNFYRMDSTLSGHTDHSEQDLEAPLLSFRSVNPAQSGQLPIGSCRM